MLSLLPLNKLKSKPIFVDSVSSHFKSALPNVAGAKPLAPL
jgi:hypothetical protein